MTTIVYARSVEQLNTVDDDVLDIHSIIFALFIQHSRWCIEGKFSQIGYRIHTIIALN